MMTATTQNILIILKAPRRNVFYIQQVGRIHSSSLFIIK